MYASFFWWSSQPSGFFSLQFGNVFSGTSLSWSLDQRLQTKIHDIYRVLSERYIHASELDQDNLVIGAIKWFVGSVGDPYTVYLDNKESSDFQESLKGTQNFEWIGAVVAKKVDGVMIEEVLKWSPAQKAWLRPLDLIIEIDSKKTNNLTLWEAVSMIRWTWGTEVELTILRTEKRWGKSENTIFKQKVIRDTINVPSISQKIIMQQNIPLLYLNIAMIGEDTEKTLKSVVKELKGADYKGIIIDLRWNGGWFLPIAVEVVSHFVPRGKEIVSAKYTIFPDEIFDSKGYGDFENYPLVVLVDWLTASAGEIIALALKEQNWATLVGTQTFGKWSIQTIEDFDDGSSLKYSIGKRYSPSWVNVDKIWITPDFIVDFDSDLMKEKQQDNQLQKAKEIIIQKITK